MADRGGLGLLCPGSALAVRLLVMSWRPLRVAEGDRVPDGFSGPALGQPLPGYLSRAEPRLRRRSRQPFMHFFIFLDVVILLIGTSLLALHEYVSSYLVSREAIVEVAMEMGGLLLIAGIIWALVRRYIQRVPRLEHRLEDAVVPIGLLIVALSGFLLEGWRLATQKPPWAHWSFVGAWIAGWVPEGAAAPPTLISGGGTP